MSHESEVYCPIKNGTCSRTEYHEFNQKLRYQYPLTYDPDNHTTDPMCGGKNDYETVDESRRYGNTVRSYPGEKCSAAVRALQRICQERRRVGKIIVDDIYTLRLVIDGQTVATISSGELTLTQG